MTSSWDDYADGWDSNPSVIEYSEKAFASLSNRICLQGLKVLDFGCGTGLLTEKIAAHAASVFAIDSSIKMIDVLKEKQLDNVNAQAGLLTPHYLQQYSEFIHGFDLIVASSVLFFVPNLQDTLLLLKQCLKPGGYLVQWDWLQTKPNSEFGFSNKMIEQAYATARLDQVAIEHCFDIVDENQPMPVIIGIAKNQ